MPNALGACKKVWPSVLNCLCNAVENAAASADQTDIEVANLDALEGVLTIDLAENPGPDLNGYVFIEHLATRSAEIVPVSGPNQGIESIMGVFLDAPDIITRGHPDSDEHIGEARQTAIVRERGDDRGHGKGARVIGLFDLFFLPLIASDVEQGQEAIGAPTGV